MDTHTAGMKHESGTRGAWCSFGSCFVSSHFHALMGLVCALQSEQAALRIAFTECTAQRADLQVERHAADTEFARNIAKLRTRQSTREPDGCSLTLTQASQPLLSCRAARCRSMPPKVADDIFVYREDMLSPAPKLLLHRQEGGQRSHLAPVAIYRKVIWSAT